MGIVDFSWKDFEEDNVEEGAGGDGLKDGRSQAPGEGMHHPDGDPHHVPNGDHGTEEEGDFDDCSHLKVLFGEADAHGEGHQALMDEDSDEEVDQFAHFVLQAQGNPFEGGMDAEGDHENEAAEATALIENVNGVAVSVPPAPVGVAVHLIPTVAVPTRGSARM